MKFNNRNVYISEKAIIGKNVRIGDNTVIYDYVKIGDNSIIANDCILGEPLNDYYFSDSYENPETVIMEGALIRSHTIIYAGSVFGENFSTGHRVTIREKSKFGNNCRLGTVTDIQGYVEFGDNCWLHSNVHIGQQSKIGNYVFIYPYVVLTNDPTPPSDTCIGVTIGDFSIIAVGTVLLPATEIGKHCLVGAQSLVGGKYEDYSLIIGNPGKRLKDVRDLKSKQTGESHYPWPDKFSRGMPWENEGFDVWKIKNGYGND
ncbi:N-acetyltransferase [Pedobacter cryoconitis]|uniref:UDP-3-O-[3-hydroxymyristoyl] glucosamine N-acyltransferase n=1 Tax=Pedobacter cryoconitis TaxID=188932 RepID=A0A7X0J5Z2_9SPHI|nr:N-acetyltransferase [Pedobacter cryoconitis]MBB6500977.1 UDP-3-O-[3-hydroxymyristoyl] glucosamine N-acyltransferase [Pedobacter cryoconitis]